jgi:hypothetical protein
VTLRDRFDPAELLRVIEAEGITQLSLVEPLLAEFADHPIFRIRPLDPAAGQSHRRGRPGQLPTEVADQIRSDPGQHLRGK